MTDADIGSDANGNANANANADADVDVDSSIADADAGTGADTTQRWTHRVRSADPAVFGLGLFAAMGVLLWTVANLSGALLPPDPLVGSAPLGFGGDVVAGVWARFDAGWYLNVARDGYGFVSVDQQANVAFFPAYPLTMRWLGWVLGGNPLLAGVMVTLASTAGAIVLFARWCTGRIGQRATQWAIVALLVYPYAWFLYGAVYADALFLVAVLGAFTLMERGHPVLAGLAGAMATATRPVGMAVVAGLVVLVWVRRGGWRGLRWGDAGVLLSLGGLVAWMGFLAARFGDPLLFSRIQGAWGQQTGLATLFKFDFLSRFTGVRYQVRCILGGGAPTCSATEASELVYTAGVAAQGLLLVAALVATPWIIRRFGWAYGVYSAAVLAPAVLGSQDFQGSGRYLLAAFPLFALVGVGLAARPRLAVMVSGVSVVMLVVLTSLFARGYYLS